MFLPSACPTGILPFGVELRHLRYVLAVAEMENVSRAVEAGTGVAIGADVFGDSFGNRLKLLHITPEPKPISVGIAALKGRLRPAAEKFWQCAKEAASPAARPRALRTSR
jgi:DNA-binding transcriptional LysR family regulator